MKKINKTQKGLPNLQFTANHEVQSCGQVMSVHELIILVSVVRAVLYINIALLIILDPHKATTKQTLYLTFLADNFYKRVFAPNIHLSSETHCL